MMEALFYFLDLMVEFDHPFYDITDKQLMAINSKNIVHLRHNESAV